MNLASQEVTIKTEDLTKIYKDFWGRNRVIGIKNVNLEIYKGEVFGIVGPNGSGKTTTLKILLGLLFPTSGKAWVLGKDPTDLKIKYRIGFLPEESYLYKFLNADETLDFFGRLFKIPYQERKKRINELISLLGLEKARKRLIGEYSKGMVRKVCLAQALINNPDVIFLDEPTSGLDPITSKQVKDLILELKDAGKTVFLSSHLLSDVQTICNRVAILHEGRVRKQGYVKELIVDTKLTKIVFRQLSEDACKKIIETAHTCGVDPISQEFAEYSLEEVFLKEILKKDEKPSGGSRTRN